MSGTKLYRLPLNQARLVNLQENRQTGIFSMPKFLASISGFARKINKSFG
jgi:hypothetical protein